MSQNIFFNTIPFDHWIIDNFLDTEVAEKLSNDFLDYNDSNWYVYNNPLEHKKTISNFYLFPSVTYQTFQYLCDPNFVNLLKELTGITNLIPDIGLHGAGWHIHGKGGKLNIHLDYSIHPKLKLQRKLNLILYLTKDWNPDWGGNLEFWTHDQYTNKPLECATVIKNKFNRAIIFDTTKNSWHGFGDPINCPVNVFRKSIAMYYLVPADQNIDLRQKALYSQTESQKGNSEIEKFIIERSR